KDKAGLVRALGHFLVDIEAAIFERDDLFLVQPALVHNLVNRDRLIFHIRLGGWIEVWFRKFGSVDWLHGETDLSLDKSLVETAVEITSDNALYRDHLQLPDNHPVRVLDVDHMMGDLQIVEPVGCKLAENFPLSRNDRGKDYVIGGYSVSENEQEFLVVELVDVLYLATLEWCGGQFALGFVNVFLHLDTTTTVLLEVLCEF